jgi:hypothetical protein
MCEQCGLFAPMVAGRWSDAAPFGVIEIHPSDGRQRTAEAMGAVMYQGRHRDHVPPHTGQPGALDALTADDWDG